MKKPKVWFGGHWPGWSDTIEDRNEFFITGTGILLALIAYLYLFYQMVIVFKSVLTNPI